MQWEEGEQETKHSFVFCEREARCLAVQKLAEVIKLTPKSVNT